MKVFSKKSFILFFVMIFTLVSISTVYGGKFTGNPSDLPIGWWFEGNTPTIIDPNKPILLFVHGLNGDYSTWTSGSNSMYNKALSQGYQTTFINLHPDKNMWTNGSLLATKIQEIYNHYNKKIVLVAHSKGGIDSQAALIHYGAHPYVSNVITLGSPHYGSQLADLANGSWTWWLGAILGQRNDATESLQTGYMSYFRSITDSHSNRLRNKYYTLAGTSTGSFFSSLYWGGLYLNSYGQNDGAVVVNNASLPYGHIVKINNWDHYNLTHGNTTFDWFRPYLTTSIAGLNTVQVASNNFASLNTSTSDVAANTLVRGNVLSKETSKEVFWVEDGVDSININFLANQPINPNHIRITSPDKNKKFDSWTVGEDTLYFNGAYYHSIKIDNPMEGEWSLEITNKNYFSSINGNSKKRGTVDYETAYVMTVTYQSDQTLNIPVEEIIDTLSDSVSVFEDSEMMKSSSSVLGASEMKKAKSLGALSKLNVKSKQVEFIPVDGGNDDAIYLEVDAKGDIENGNLSRFNASMKNKKGVINVTLDISGVNGSNSRFERTIVKSVYVDENGKVYY